MMILIMMIVLLSFLFFVVDDNDDADDDVDDDLHFAVNVATWIFSTSSTVQSGTCLVCMQACDLNMNPPLGMNFLYTFRTQGRTETSCKPVAAYSKLVGSGPIPTNCYVFFLPP